MSARWFIADTHFGHEKVAELRGFSSTEDHDAAIIEDWTARVGKDDTVFVLGDISSGRNSDVELRALDIIGNLPGQKRLIAGNHDSVSGIHRRPSKNFMDFARVFQTINDFGRVKIETRHVMMSHFPFTDVAPFAVQGDGPGRGNRHDEVRLMDKNNLLIHGHTHHDHPTNASKSGRELCVSWDAWGRMVSDGDVSLWVRHADAHL